MNATAGHADQAAWEAGVRARLDEALFHIAHALAGILEYDVEIVSAWERASGSPQRVWPVRGRQSRAGAVIPGEVVRRELEG